MTSKKHVPWKLSVSEKVMLTVIIWHGSQPGAGPGVVQDQALVIPDPWLLAWSQAPDAVMQGLSTKNEIVSSWTVISAESSSTGMMKQVCQLIP